MISVSQSGTDAQPCHVQVNTAGGWIRNADVKALPASTKMSGALVKAEPYALRQLHWHLAMNEWQFLINGTLEVRQTMPSSPGISKNSRVVMGGAEASVAAA